MKRIHRIEPGQDVSAVAPLFGIPTTEAPTSPKQFQVVVVSANLAVRLNEQWHSRLPLFGGCPRVSYALTHNERYYGVAIWSSPVARLLPQLEWLELRRMALAPEVPYNTASWFLARMERLIPVAFPDVVRLISYQDTEAHQGTIYKASNWVNAHTGQGQEWTRPSRRSLPQQSAAPKIRWEKELNRR